MTYYLPTKPNKNPLRQHTPTCSRPDSLTWFKLAVDAETQIRLRKFGTSYYHSHTPNGSKQEQPNEQGEEENKGEDKHGQHNEKKDTPCSEPRSNPVIMTRQQRRHQRTNDKGTSDTTQRREAPQ